jgi:hypothetical protein
MIDALKEEFVTLSPRSSTNSLLLFPSRIKHPIHYDNFYAANAAKRVP